MASALYRLELGSAVSVAAASAALWAASYAASRGRAAVDAPSAPSASGPWLGLSLLLPVAVVALPYANVGGSVPEGQAYRAYFSADLMTHLSVIAELQKGTFPLENPFYLGGHLGYYWLFFTFPAAFGGLVDNQTAILLVDIAGGALFAGLVFAAGRRLGLEPRKAFAAVTALVACVGFEGVLALARSEPWTDVNVDAMSRWVFQLVSLDGLHRSLLYTPQHLFSYSLLLVLVLLLLSGRPRTLGDSVLAGVLLGGMAGTSIVTAMLGGPWLVLVLWLRRDRIAFWRLAPAATVVSLVFLLWYVALGFFGGAGGALTVRVPALLELPSILLLDAGALVALALLRGRNVKTFDPELLLLALLAVVAVLFLDLRGYEGVWIAWRAGSVLLVALGLYALRDLRLAYAIVLLPAALTTALDVYNASDVTNRRMSPGGFPWTTVVRSDEVAALEWLRTETPSDAVVQWDTRAREPGEWALIPALAERRMAVGAPIFLLDLRKYRVRERRHVRPIFTSGDPVLAHELARSQGIDFLVVGAQELRVRGELVRPLFEDDARFRPVFERGEVTILAVSAP